MLSAMATERGRVPDRLVDVTWQGWHRIGGGKYRADFGARRNLADSTFEHLEDARGPLRPVVSASDQDAEAVRAALRRAGRAAAGSLLVAVYRLTERYEQAAFAQRDPYADKLYAGREGSWQSETMQSLAQGIGGDLARKPRRYNKAAVAALTGVIDSWVTGPHRYVEVAETLSRLFGEAADAAGGWSKVADQWLQPGRAVGHTEHLIQAVHDYLMSTSSSRHGSPRPDWARTSAGCGCSPPA